MAKFLLVDDDWEITELLSELLIQENHESDIAETGMEGWKMAQSNAYDLLILDWDLPDLNGINILSRFRRAGFRAPVIMLTGHASSSDKELALDSGADDYLTKPFAKDELMARIRAVMRRTEPKVPIYESLGDKELLKRADLDGTLLSTRYELLEIIGEGGSGIVFKARQASIDKLVAVKMLHGEEKDLEQSTERFTREAKAISRLDHPNTINIIDFGLTERGKPYMVMEYFAGGSLFELVRREGALAPQLALDLGIQICDGMSHAHSFGILHRDLKPANILLKYYQGKNPVAKIVDFGMAKILENEDKNGPMLTREGQIFGSPAYMSPEQAKGQTTSTLSDIYSLGCILYEMLSGCPPHFAANSMEMIIKHLTAEPLALKELRPDLNYPDGCDPLLKRAMSKDPQQRHQSMSELKAELESIREACKADS